VGITLDTGALIAFERGDAAVLSRLRALWRSGREPTISVASVAEAWRDGSRQVRLRRLLEASAVEPVNEELARRAGELLARTRTANALDAIVAVSAASRGDLALTSDPADLQRLADDLGSIRIVAV
jgi:predicted nucleic acid-binding protein